MRTNILDIRWRGIPFTILFLLTLLIFLAPWTLVASFQQHPLWLAITGTLLLFVGIGWAILLCWTLYSSNEKIVQDFKSSFGEPHD